MNCQQVVTYTLMSSLSWGYTDYNHHDITELLLKVWLSTITLNLTFKLIKDMGGQLAKGIGLHLQAALHTFL